MFLLLLLACPNKDPGPLDSDTSLVDPVDSSEPAQAEGLRWGCAGLDPYDAAPLGGKVALTFDDGPDPEDTPDILDTLRLYQVPATFFVVGEMASGFEGTALVEEIRDDPLFEIGNHSWSHPDILGLDAGEALDEIVSTSELLAELDVTPRFFRFPYGNSDCERVEMAREAGMISTGWHIDTADWCYASGTPGRCTPSDYSRVPPEYSEDMLGFTLTQLQAYDGGVVLLHDIHAYTADNLSALIELAEAEGFEFVALDDAEAFPGLNQDLPAELPRTGEACSVSEDPCWQIEWNSWCEPTGSGGEGLCVLECWDTCVPRAGSARLICAEAPNEGEGHCLPESSPLNAECAALPGTHVERVAYYGVGVGLEYVCLPDAW